jgi:hypothetical protein
MNSLLLRLVRVALELWQALHSDHLPWRLLIHG